MSLDVKGGRRSVFLLPFPWQLHQGSPSYQLADLIPPRWPHTTSLTSYHLTDQHILTTTYLSDSITGPLCQCTHAQEPITDSFPPSQVSCSSTLLRLSLDHHRPSTHKQPPERTRHACILLNGAKVNTSSSVVYMPPVTTLHALLPPPTASWVTHFTFRLLWLSSNNTPCSSPSYSYLGYSLVAP